MNEYIIPPITNKNSYLNNKIITSLWIDFKKYINEADTLIFIGYSLPESDSYLRAFLKSYTNEHVKIIVVNLKSGIKALKSNYEDVFLSKNIDYSFCLNDGAIESFVKIFEEIVKET